jgi:glycerol uptake facilitator-like aquaporin
MNYNSTKKAAAEFVGTAFLLMVVVGSGIMGERLAGGNDAVALLANTIATGAGLVFLILSFGGVSGAHFNSVVTLAEAWRGNLAWREAPIYLTSQIAGGVSGVAVANYMFGLPALHASTKLREGLPIYAGEFVATFGLLGVIFAGSKFHKHLVPFMVAAYITAAYWFTSSTSFANPAVTIARSLSNTFAGICYRDVPAFIVAQVIGATAAVLFFGWLLSERESEK